MSTIYQKRAGIDEPLNVYRTKDFRVFLILQTEETIMETVDFFFQGSAYSQKLVKDLCYFSHSTAERRLAIKLKKQNYHPN